MPWILLTLGHGMSPVGTQSTYMGDPDIFGVGGTAMFAPRTEEPQSSVVVATGEFVSDMDTTMVKEMG
jgi:hypothetical protein